jgi:hypothetical protein
VEVLVVLGGDCVGRVLPGDTSHHLGDENKIDDQWRGQERVLTDIEETTIVSVLKKELTKGLTKLSDDHP